MVLIIMKRFKLISLIVLAVLGLVILLQNTAEVETRILFISFSMPRAFLLLFTLAIGFGLGLLTAHLWPRWRAGSLGKES